MSLSERPSRSPAADSAVPAQPSSQDRGNPAPPAKPVPKPKSSPKENPLRRDHSPGESASGFVGMLAKGKLGSGDSHMPELTLNSDETRPSQTPKYKLRMAREIPPAQPIPPISPPRNAPVKPESTIPISHDQEIPPPARSFKTAILLALAVPFLAVGLWAAGALLYMSSSSTLATTSSRYPLIHPQALSPDPSHLLFPQNSWIIAWALLACLPLAGACLWKAAKLRGRTHGRT